MDFTIPHKKIIDRNFVLIPLKEISPAWQHPVSNTLIDDFINKLPEEDKNSILKIKKS